MGHWEILKPFPKRPFKWKQCDGCKELKESRTKERLDSQLGGFLSFLGRVQGKVVKGQQRWK